MGSKVTLSLVSTFYQEKSILFSTCPVFLTVNQSDSLDFEAWTEILKTADVGQQSDQFNPYISDFGYVATAVYVWGTTDCFFPRPVSCEPDNGSVLFFLCGD